MVNLTNLYLGEAVGRKFVEKNFNPEAKRKASEMTGKIIEVMRERIESLDWMGPETRKEALAKLDTLAVKIGYPDQWQDYSDFPVDRKDFYGNIMAGTRRELRRTLDSIGKPIDKAAWGIYPTEVNAYYNPSGNETGFPAARLMPPFFDLNADEASNYGSTGVTIAHEIIHGFDDSGSHYDSTGQKRDWWQPADREGFQAIAQAVSDQMDGYSYDGVQNSGKQTTGEALADLGGIEIAYEALKRVLTDEPPVESDDGFSPEQRFFLSYALARQDKYRPKAARQQVQDGVHPLPEFRVNAAVTNFEPFYEAFDVQPGDPLYLKPQDRIKFWD